MKRILILIMLAFSLNGMSQVMVNGVDVNKQDVEYCKLIGYNKSLFGNKIIITIDYGQKMKFTQAQTITGKNGKAIVFNSVIGALNFMQKNGWEYVNNYAIAMGQSNVYHYLLKRKD